MTAPQQDREEWLDARREQEPGWVRPASTDDPVDPYEEAEAYDDTNWPG